MAEGRSKKSNFFSILLLRIQNYMTYVQHQKTCTLPLTKKFRVLLLKISPTQPDSEPLSEKSILIVLDRFFLAKLILFRMF